jgi:1-acyl-sn-glycerol-3-phosphate acyltransferase
LAIDLDLMRGIRLSGRPRFQIFVGHTFLRLVFNVPRKTEIVIEGLENIPSDRTVFYAMNHTDKYNYWPFQYELWRKRGRFTATWVKGKYFESKLLSHFLVATNNIPLPSRGYVIATEFRRTETRVPDAAEYRVLRDLADGVRSDATGASDAVKRFVDGGGLARFEENFRQMMGAVVHITKDALTRLELDVLIFPQGTRSIRLSRGHTGLAQVSQSFGTTIVPIGCSGSDKLYPGGSPWPKGGRVTYRIGKPLDPEGPELSPHRVREPFEPLVPETNKAHGEKFRAITDIVMARINALVDPPYQYAEGATSDGVRDMERFL